MFDVITIGDCVNDIFITPCSSHFCSKQINMQGDKLMIRHGDKISVDEIYNSLGGSAANVAVGLTRLGLKTTIISSVGKDQIGEEIKAKLGEELVDTSLLKTLSTKTSTSIIIIFDKERTVFIYRGLKDYGKLKLPKNLHTSWIYLGPVSNEYSINYNQLISLSCEKNVQIALNPGNRQIEKGKNDLMRILKVTKVLILNLQEALDLTELPTFTDIKKLLLVIKNFGPQTVIITDGKNGAYAFDGEEYWKVDIYSSVTVVEPTGAGDAFSSGFLASYIEEGDLKEALKWGIINSTMVIENYGAQTNLQTKNKIEKLLQNPPRLYKL